MNKRKSFLLIVSILVLLIIGYLVESNNLSEDKENIQLVDSIPLDEVDWWIPSVEDTWQWQLSGDINKGYDVDIYDVDLVNTPQSIIDELHNRGIKVICYFSAGSWEEFRSDAKDFPNEVLGDKLDGWDDERWLDISNYQKFSSIVEARLDLAVAKGCDGVEPDNVDGFQNNSGFSLTSNDQLIYNRWLASESHQRKLSIGLKNDLDQIKDLVGVFDFAVNEQCFQYDECDELLPFVNQGKAVLGVEYELETDEFCKKAKSMKFSWLKMDYDLDGERVSCK